MCCKLLVGAAIIGVGLALHSFGVYGHEWTVGTDAVGIPLIGFRGGGFGPWTTCETKCDGECVCLSRSIQFVCVSVLLSMIIALIRKKNSYYQSV